MSWDNGHASMDAVLCIIDCLAVPAGMYTALLLVLARACTAAHDLLCADSFAGDSPSRSTSG